MCCPLFLRVYDQDRVDRLVSGVAVALPHEICTQALDSVAQAICDRGLEDQDADGANSIAKHVDSDQRLARTVVPLADRVRAAPKLAHCVFDLVPDSREQRITFVVLAVCRELLNVWPSRGQFRFPYPDGCAVGGDACFTDADLDTGKVDEANVHALRATGLDRTEHAPCCANRHDDQSARAQIIEASIREPTRIPRGEVGDLLDSARSRATLDETAQLRYCEVVEYFLISLNLLDDVEHCLCGFELVNHQPPIGIDADQVWSRLVFQNSLPCYEHHLLAQIPFRVGNDAVFDLLFEDSFKLRHEGAPFELLEPRDHLGVEALEVFGVVVAAAAEHDLVDAEVLELGEALDDLVGGAAERAGADLLLPLLRRLLVVGQHAGHQGGDFDFGGVAADVFAVSVEDVDFLLEQFDRHPAPSPAVEVHHVAVHRQRAERSLRSRTADQNWDRLVVCAGREWGVVERVVLAVERDRFVSGVKDGTQHFAGFFEAVLALAHTGEFPAVGVVLAAEPGGADAEREASVRDVVDAAGDFGCERRIAVGVAEHEVSDAEPLGAGGDGGGQREGFVGLAALDRLAAVGRHEVVGEPDRVVVAGVHRPGDGADVVPRGEVGADLGSELHGGSSRLAGDRIAAGRSGRLCGEGGRHGVASDGMARAPDRKGSRRGDRRRARGGLAGAVRQRRRCAPP